jgi:type II secretory pathway component PulF
VLLPNLALLLTSGARGYLRAVGPPLFSIWTSVAAALLLCRAVAGTWAASRLGDAALALPALGPLFCAAGFADWIEAFSLLHRSGVPMVEGLERAADSVRNARLRASAHRVAEAVRGGAKLSEAVAAERGPLFPPMFVESARIAEESGKYDETFERAAKFAREEAEKKFRRLVGAILAVAYIGAAAYVGYTVLTFYAGMYRGLLDR